MANSPTIAAPIQLLQEKVLLHNPKASSKLLSLALTLALALALALTLIRTLTLTLTLS